jgi:putative nucleotidyltransferase with HDIG domain
MTRPDADVRVRAAVAGVGASGAALALWCAWSIARAGLPASSFVLAGLTLAASVFTLRIPSIESTLAVSEIFALTSVLLYGPEAGALLFGGVAIVLSLRSHFSAAQKIFNFGNLCVSGWLAGVAFFGLARVAPLYLARVPFAPLLMPLAVMTLVYYLCNSGLTAGIVAASSGRAFSRTWREHFLPLAPSYVAGSSVALLLVVAMREIHFAAVALILPMLFISYVTLRTSFGRLEDAKAHVGQLNRLLFSTVETLATAIDAKDEVTHDHVRRVQRGTVALARELGVTDDGTLKAIETAALLHDTGKIAVPEHILNKPGRLTPLEFEKMKRHAPVGAEILSSIEFPYPVTPIVRHHHENWDGSGYPDGLAGTDIPLGARILSVVDCFDALTSDRPYRRRMSDDQALAILLERRGTMYDPIVVDAFVGAHGRIMPAADAELHPAARAIGDARARTCGEAAVTAEIEAPATSAVGEALLAVTSLSRALSGQAQAGDVGALTWTILRQLLPCDAMSLSFLDVRRDAVAVRFSAGRHAAFLRARSCPMGAGVTGWVAVHQRAALNADPAVEFGPAADGLSPPFRSCLAVPLGEADATIAVLAFYSERAGAYSDDHVRLLELLAPRLTSALLDNAIADEEAGAAAPSAATVALRLVAGGRLSSAR